MLPVFTNMLSWWQWAILASVPAAVVLLYFLKLRRRPLEVPSTYLWHKSIEDCHVNSIWQRLRNNPLLYLQLAVLIVLILAVLRPSWRTFRVGGERLVLLIDNSASMQATDVPPNRLEAAKRRAAELIDRMGTADSIMLISFADTARVEQSFTNNRQQLRAALDAIRPSQRSTNISEALKLAAGLVNPGQSNEDSDDLKVAGSKLYIFSDGRFPAVDQFELGNLEPTFVPIGRSDAANVGIVAFGAGRSEDGGGRLQAYARLSNPGPTEADVLLRLFVNDRARPSDADRISIPAGETRSVAFDLPDFESGVLHLQAETGDRLGLDDEAWTIVGPPRRARVLVITPGNEPLEQALTTKAAAAMSDIRLESPEFLKSKTYQDQVDLGVWDLVVYDRTPPAKMPRTNTFFLGCLPPGGGWQARPEVALPQIIDAALSHRLMQWVDVNEIQKVISARPLVVPGGGTVLMDSDRGPLMAIAPREGFEDLVLGMSLVERRDGASYRNTDWPWRASFACLVYNLLVDRSGGQDSAGANDLRPGMPVTVEAPDARTGLDVQLPSGANVQLPPAAAGKAVFTASEELGVYRVLRGGNAAPSFAVNLLDAAETNIRPPEDPAIKIGYVEVAGKSGRIARPMDGFVVYLPWPRAGGIGLTDVQIKYWQVLVLLGLFIAAAEWIVYLRRVYV